VLRTSWNRYPLAGFTAQCALDGRVRKYTFRDGDVELSCREAIELWQSSPDFRSFFNRMLAEVPFSAFRWEMPALSLENVDRRFECAVLDSPGLAREPEAEAFAEHFASEAVQASSVISFANLSGDALLIVPCPIAEPTAYGHLAAFVRSDPIAQQHELWRLVGETMSSNLGDDPRWLSTAGAGVSWLHVRIDNRPKYYGYAPYRAVR
jgi:hypothetical protein